MLARRVGWVVGCSVALLLVVFVGVSPAPISSGGVGSAKPIPHTSQAYDASCPTVGACALVGAGAGAIPQGEFALVNLSKRLKFNSFKSVSASVGLYGVSCPTSRFCLAVGQKRSGGSVIAPLNKGKLGKIRSVKDNLISVGCTPKLSCWITGVSSNGSHAIVIHTVGPSAKIKQTQQVKGNPYLFSAGEGAASPPPLCRSATQCIGVGTANFSKGPGLIYTLKNGKIANVTKVTGTTALTGLACLSSSRCMVSGVKKTGATSYVGVALQLHNGKPGPVQAVKGTNYLGAVACKTASRCMVFGDTAKSSVAVPVVSGKIGKLIKLSFPVHAATCNTRGCMAVGTTSKFNGTTETHKAFALHFF